jgi:hypothetical protein
VRKKKLEVNVEKTKTMVFNKRKRGSSVSAWLSETVLRGRGPGASEFKSHRRGRIFSKEGTSAGPWMCVYVFQGLTVGWWKEERQERRGWAWVAGESTPEPHRTTKGKKREKQLADRKVPDRLGVVKGEGLKKTRERGRVKRMSGSGKKGK